MLKKIFLLLLIITAVSCSGKKNITPAVINNASYNAEEKKSGELLSREDKLLRQYQKNQNNSDAIYELGKFYFETKKYDLLLYYINKLRTVDKKLYKKAEEEYIIKTRADVEKNIKEYVKNSNFEKAVNEYTRLINMFPEISKYKYELASVYIKIEKVHTALLYINDFFKNNPEDIFLNAALGDIYYFSKNYELAKDYYNRSEGIEEYYFEPAIRRALIYANELNLEKSEKIMLNVFDYHKDNIDVIHQIAKLYSKFYKYDKAVIYYKKLIEFFDGDIMILINAGETAILANDNEFAIKLAQQILKLDNSAITGWMLLSKAYTNKGDYMSAYRCNEEIQKLRKY